MSSADTCDAQQLFVRTHTGLGARGLGVRLGAVQCRVLPAGRCGPGTGSVRAVSLWCRPSRTATYAKSAGAESCWAPRVLRDMPTKSSASTMSGDTGDKPSVGYLSLIGFREA
jgi:hypothetical protein